MYALPSPCLDRSQPSRCRYPRRTHPPGGWGQHGPLFPSRSRPMSGTRWNPRLNRTCRGRHRGNYLPRIAVPGPQDRDRNRHYCPGNHRTGKHNCPCYLLPHQNPAPTSVVHPRYAPTGNHHRHRICRRMRPYNRFHQRCANRHQRGRDQNQRYAGIRPSGKHCQRCQPKHRRSDQSKTLPRYVPIGSPRMHLISLHTCRNHPRTGGCQHQPGRDPDRSFPWNNP